MRKCREKCAIEFVNATHEPLSILMVRGNIRVHDTGFLLTQIPLSITKPRTFKRFTRLRLTWRSARARKWREKEKRRQNIDLERRPGCRGWYRLTGARNSVK